MLKVENLRKTYKTGNNSYLVLKDLSFQVKKGEFVAVMGPSGSGKTTLLNCISCFIPHDQGKILLNRKDLSGLGQKELAKVRNQHLGFVFQDFMLLDSRSCKAVIDAFLQAKEQLEATVFMVTHDSYAASFCDRVIVLRDGAVHTELTRRGYRREFMDELLDVLRELGGDRDDQE